MGCPGGAGCTCPTQDARQRIMDPAAVGPQDQNVSQRTFLNAQPRIGRADPENADYPLAKLEQDDTGGCTYSDLWADGDSWVDPGDGPDLTPERVMRLGG